MSTKLRTIYHSRNFVVARLVIYMTVIIMLAVMLHKQAAQKRSAPAAETPESPPVAEALLANLEAVADKHLPSPALDEGMPEATVAVPAPDRTAPLLIELARDLKGSALSGSHDTASVRILFAIPAESLSEFSRRAELLIGHPLAQPIDGSVFAITLEKATSPTRP